MNASSESATLPELYSLEAEQSIIGAVIIHQESYHTVVDDVGLAADHFYVGAHRAIFTAFGQLKQRGKDIDLVTLSEHLENHGRLDEVGGIEYLTDIAANTPGHSNAANYARIVIERYQRRRLLQIGKELQESAKNPEGREIADLVAEAERSVLEISENATHTLDTADSETIYSAALERIDERMASDSPLIGLSTGFKALDEKTLGLLPGSLNILSGRPSMGKTSLALSMVSHAQAKTGRPIMFFSLEMDEVAITQRQLSLTTKIPLSDIKAGRLTASERQRIGRMADILRTRPLGIARRTKQPYEMRAACRRFKHKHNDLALIVIDYLGRMTEDLKKGKSSSESRAYELASITNALKDLAVEMNCPVLLLSQLNRSIESRPNKRPMNSDLSGSGSIEADADLILHLYRDEFYNPDTPDEGIAEIIVGKQRDGETGTVKLRFIPELTAFQDLP